MGNQFTCIQSHTSPPHTSHRTISTTIKSNNKLIISPYISKHIINDNQHDINKSDHVLLHNDSINLIVNNSDSANNKQSVHPVHISDISPTDHNYLPRLHSATKLHEHSDLSQYPYNLDSSFAHSPSPNTYNNIQQQSQYNFISPDKIQQHNIDNTPAQHQIKHDSDVSSVLSHSIYHLTPSTPQQNTAPHDPTLRHTYSSTTSTPNTKSTDSSNNNITDELMQQPRSIGQHSWTNSNSYDDHSSELIDSTIHYNSSINSHTSDKSSPTQYKTNSPQSILPVVNEEQSIDIKQRYIRSAPGRHNRHQSLIESHITTNHYSNKKKMNRRRKPIIRRLDVSDSDVDSTDEIEQLIDSSDDDTKHTIHNTINNKQQYYMTSPPLQSRTVNLYDNTINEHELVNNQPSINVYKKCMKSKRSPYESYTAAHTVNAVEMRKLLQQYNTNQVLA